MYTIVFNCKVHYFGNVVAFSVTRVIKVHVSLSTYRCTWLHINLHSHEVLVCVEHQDDNVQLQKISILPPQKRLDFLGGGGSVRPKKLKKCTCMKLNSDFQRGGGS